MTYAQVILCVTLGVLGFLAVSQWVHAKTYRHQRQTVWFERRMMERDRLCRDGEERWQLGLSGLDPSRFRNLWAFAAAVYGETFEYQLQPPALLISSAWEGWLRPRYEVTRTFNGLTHAVYRVHHDGFRTPVRVCDPDYGLHSSWVNQSRQPRAVTCIQCMVRVLEAGHVEGDYDYRGC